MVAPLKLHTLEAKPKRVIQIESWRVLVAQSEEVKSGLAHIYRSIVNGTPLPEGFYRAQRTSTPDELLATEGIMHLHVTGKPNSSELLYLMQFPIFVAFLELSDHSHFKNQPPGSVLLQLHARKLAQAQEEEGQRLADLKARVAAGLTPQRPKT
ncbi:MAG: hypothetical protein K5Q68_24215 [Roseococcus sp.]|nr:hypothetical protein [Roseococcus sp.]